MSTSSWRLLVSGLLVLVAWPGLALAEGLEPCVDEPVRDEAEARAYEEVAHRVEARIEGDLVHLTVRRTFHNPSTRYIETEDFLPLPWNATVHGFAYESRGKWTDGVLLKADEAARRFESLRSKGRAEPRTVALLSWEGSNASMNSEMKLRMWNVPPRESVTVRYGFRMRLDYAGGRRSFTYPDDEDEGGVRPELTLAAPSPGADVRIARADRTIKVSWVPEALQRLEARAGFLPLGPDSRGLVRILVPPRLSEAPARARVVFVVDASHSMGPEGITQALAIAEASLRRLPDAMAEVVVFRRSAERLFGRFISAADWKTALAAVPATRLEPGNGSHVDEGLRLAQRVLAEGSGPARVLVLTDGLLREGYTRVPSSATTSASDAAVHLLLMLTPREVSSLGHDELRRMPVVQGSCGDVFYLSFENLPSSEALESMARPTQLQALRLEDEQGQVVVKGLAHLGEGEMREVWLKRPEASLPQMWLRGDLWNCPAVDLRVELEPALSADLGRYVYVSESEEDESASEAGGQGAPSVRQRLAADGDWLSSVHSFLAAPVGVAPSSIRTRALGNPCGGVIGGVIGFAEGSLCGCSVGGGKRQASEAELLAELTRLLRPVIASCPREGGGQPLQARVEVTAGEIVDVEVKGAASAVQESCVREATWALRLPALFDDAELASHTVMLRP